MTGDLSLVENDDLRRLLSYGPSYREALPVNWDDVLSEVLTDLDPMISRWADTAQTALWSEWKEGVIQKVKDRISKLKKRKVKDPLPGLSNPEIRRSLRKLHDDYVLTPADKAANNVIIVCKQYYLSLIVKELMQNKDATFEYVAAANPKETVNALKNRIRDLFEIETLEAFENLASIYWSGKMHKNPFSQRFISASNRCVLKGLSAQLTRILKALIRPIKGLCTQFKNKTRVSPWWVIDNSSTVLSDIKRLNQRRLAQSVHSFDFKNLYTKLPHGSIKQELEWVVDQAFAFSKKKNYPFLKVTPNSVAFRKTNKTGKGKVLSKERLKTMISFLIDNLFLGVGEKVFRQCIGIPMGTDCAPFIANLYLFAYEYKYLNNLYNTKQHKKLQQFKHCYRYIDDLLSINNTMINDISQIYPKELTLERTNKNDYQTDFLDLNIKINDKNFYISIYDKTDDFNFTVVKYPHLSGNIHFKRSHGLISSLLLRTTVCSHFTQFQKRAQLITRRLIKRGFCKQLLKKQIQKFFMTHNYAVKKYRTDILTFVSSCFDTTGDVDNL